MLDRVLYLAPRRTELMRRGYRAVSAMRNAGAACSNGELLAFVDDFMHLDPEAIDAVVQLWRTDGRVLCPVYNAAMEPPDAGLHIFSGHNPGIYLCSRQDFAALNGYDENYDGSYGEEDTDFEDRLDRLLWNRGQNDALRLRQQGVRFERTEHENNDFAEPMDKPWEYEDATPGYLRCNRAYFNAVSHPRKERNQLAANDGLNDEDMVHLQEHRCTETCSVCNRSDRALQVESYVRFLPDSNVGNRVLLPGIRPAGSYDPWSPGAPFSLLQE
jgi:hypothetical protein